jgi:glycosyltransferase involved in cell wall biosynthesis
MINTKKKLVRITTVPVSLRTLLKNQLRYMSTHFEVLAVSSPGKLLEEVSTQEGVRTAPIQMERAPAPFKDLRSLYRLYRLLKKEKPFIVHTHTPKAGLLGMLAAWFARVPVRLHTVAGLPLMESTGLKRKGLEFFERVTYKCAHKVFPNSGNLAAFILENKFCKPGKLKVLGNGSSNGIDTDFFQLSDDVQAEAEKLKASLPVKENDFVFVFVGRVVKDKGIEELIQAFVQLKATHSNIKLLLVGDYEPELDPLSEEVNNIIQIDKDIIRVGFQKDVRPYLAISDALAFPSYREGFPNVPMQAGCLHLPSIVTNINGCNEIVENGKNGLIIPAKNVQELQKSMEMILTDQALYKNLKTNARKLILDRYEQKYFWSLLLNEYDAQLKLHDVS